MLVGAPFLLSDSGGGTHRDLHSFPTRRSSDLHRRPHAGTLWVLAPIRWTPKTASLRYAWDEPGSGGCFGGGQLRYTRERGSWELTWGIAYEGCSVTSAGGSSA